MMSSLLEGSLCRAPYY